MEKLLEISGVNLTYQSKTSETVALSDLDLEILDNRDDDKFSQKVRNIKSHDTIASLVYTVGQRDRQWYLK